MFDTNKKREKLTSRLVWKKLYYHLTNIFNSYTTYIYITSFYHGREGGEKILWYMLNDVSVIFSTWQLIPLYIHSEAIVEPQ